MPYHTLILDTNELPVLLSNVGVVALTEEVQDNIKRPVIAGTPESDAKRAAGQYYEKKTVTTIWYNGAVFSVRASINDLVKVGFID